MADTADLDYVHVVQRLGATVGDTPDDVDSNPDFVPVTEGTATIVPTSPEFRVMVNGAPVSAMNAPIVCTIDPQGYLSYNGVRGVWIVDLGSDKVIPPVPREQAAYTVTYSNLKFGTQIFKKAPVSINPDATALAGADFNLTDATSLPLPAGVTMAYMQSLADEAVAAKDALLAQKGQPGGIAALSAGGDVLDASGQPVTGATDAGVAGYVTGGGETQAALDGAYAAKSWVGATPPLPLNSVTIAAEGTPAVRPFESMGGHLWGYSNTPDLYRSDDNGATWVLHTTLPSGQVQRIAETSDGGVVAVTDLAIYKSANFYDAAPTWSASKKDVNGGARFTRFGFSGDGSKFIAAEYGPGDANFADSRYAHVSLDAGETWATVWDSDTITANAPADSHVHGCCYDPWEDAFYVVEGHSVDAGIWRSDDNGATWVLHEGMRAYSAPTCVVATDDGLVCTSDDPKSGLWGVPRAGAPELRTIIRTWDWRQGYDGVIGFGQQAVRDPETGIVYAVYQSSFPDVAPIIAGGTATVGGLMWEYPNLPVTAGDELSALCLGDNGKVMVPAFINGQRQTVTAYRTNHGQSATADPGGVTGGSAVNGSSLAVGAKSVTGDAIRATAVGVRAAAAQDAVAIGYETDATTGSKGTAIGTQSQVVGTTTAIGYQAKATSGGGTTAVGNQASTVTGGQGTALGANAKAWTSGTALGNSADVGATDGAALGQAAKVNAGNLRSVALGAKTSTTKADQVQVGPRHFELGEVATEPGAGGADTGRLYLRDNGAGKSELVVQFSTGTPIVLATEV